MRKILMIDNFDSFTYNLVQGFRSLGTEVVVFRNDAITIDEAKALAPDFLVISPGPGRPKDAGISMEIIKAFASNVPILGVCLGHQCIVEVFGGKITYAKQLMHGKTSAIEHDEQSIFKNIKTPMTHRCFYVFKNGLFICLLYTSPSPRDLSTSRMPSSA